MLSGCFPSRREQADAEEELQEEAMSCCGRLAVAVEMWIVRPALSRTYLKVLAFFFICEVGGAGVMSTVDR